MQISTNAWTHTAINVATSVSTQRAHTDVTAPRTRDYGWHPMEHTVNQVRKMQKVAIGCYIFMVIACESTNVELNLMAKINYVV